MRSAVNPPRQASEAPEHVRIGIDGANDVVFHQQIRRKICFGNTSHQVSWAPRTVSAWRIKSLNPTGRYEESRAQPPSGSPRPAIKLWDASAGRRRSRPTPE